jgi:hypothetical protein
VSRPPFPHPTHTTGGDQTGDLRRLDYLPLAYAELLALQQRLAATKLRRAVEQSDADVGAADMARTFMELSALVAHVLSVYQRYYAGEAYLSTAQSPSSLVRHAHRLAYEPDPGVAASGYVVLFTKDGVDGAVAAGLPLASVPLGDLKAQDYETRDGVVVDAALNELVPLHARKPVAALDADAQQVRLQGVGHGLENGDTVALIGDRWVGLVVLDVSEDPTADVTTVTFDRRLGDGMPVDSLDPPMLLAHPSLSLQPFGVDADPSLFPPSHLKTATGTQPAESVTDAYWYTVQRADGGGYDVHDIYFSQQVRERLSGSHVVRASGDDLSVLSVTAQADAAVTFAHRVDTSFKSKRVNITKTADGGFRSELQDTDLRQSLSTTSHIGGSVTAIQAEEKDGRPTKRTDQPIPARWLAKWSVEATVATDAPNPHAVASPLVLPGVFLQLTPARPLVFSNRVGTQAQVVSVNHAEFDETAGTTSVYFDAVTSPPMDGWFLDDLKVYGNVVRASHGRTVLETLGGSDGVSPFQRFVLKESPVTVLQGAAGGEPQLDVRVDDILWERVGDFATSGPDDRHYRMSTDDHGVATIVFGDGRSGAVPPWGNKNITAVYRVGLGRVGDVEPPRLSRLKRANPLLDRAVNVTPVGGGAERADAEAIRAQATRWIRTFDRAVSVSDLADLALTMPGVARTASRWDQATGAILVVATAEGNPPPALDAVRVFLDARRDLAVPLELRGPQARSVRLTVELEPDPAYLVEIVKDGIRNALLGDDEAAPGLFRFAARGLGQPVFLSEVYERLEAVPGVIGVRITHFKGDGSDDVADVVTAGVDEWLQLLPNDLTLTTAAPVTVT